MTNTLLIFIAAMVFVIGIVSPHLAGKIQRKTNKKAGILKRCANWLWDPLTWWAKNSIEFTRKAIVKIAMWGKMTRRKFTKKDKTKK